MFVPVRVQLTPSSVLMVSTDYPYEDVVTVLLSNLTRATPLRVRIPGWATRATAVLNGAPVSASTIRNGTMLKVDCPVALGTTSALCNLTVRLNPALRLERTYGSAVSVLRGSLLFSADIGSVFHKYTSARVPCAPTNPDRTGSDCGFSPYQPRAAIALLNYTASIGAEQGWYGVSNGSAANLALVVEDEGDLDAAFEVVRPGLACSVAPPGASWPLCALRSPPQCTRTCAAPFNNSDVPIYLKGRARLVRNWTFVRPGYIEAAVPPQSPACAEAGACDEPVDLRLVPHGATDVRVGTMPIA